MNTTNFYTVNSLFKKASARVLAFCFYIAGVLFASASAALLIAFESAK